MLRLSVLKERSFDPVSILQGRSYAPRVTLPTIFSTDRVEATLLFTKLNLWESINVIDFHKLTLARYSHYYLLPITFLPLNKLGPISILQFDLVRIVVSLHSLLEHVLENQMPVHTHLVHLINSSNNVHLKNL